MAFNLVVQVVLLSSITMHSVKDKEVNEDVEFVLIGAGKNERDLTQTILALIPRPPQNRHGLHLHRPGEATARAMSPHVQSDDREQ